jgi:hypothetical protein
LTSFIVSCPWTENTLGQQGPTHLLGTFTSYANAE